MLEQPLMQALYLENFRGFKKTLICFKDVNFIVGENSTGKSSVLGLLSLLQDPNFWMFQRFNSSEVELGHFEDIASQGSGQNNFTIGVVSSKRNLETKKRPSAYAFLKFKNDKNLPLLSELQYELSGIDVRVVVERDALYYATRKLPTQTKALENINVCNALRNNKVGYSKYKKINGSYQSSGSIPIFLITNLINNQINQSRQKAEQGFFASREFEPENLCWIAPIRAKPKRVYDNYKISISPEGEHIPYLLKSFLLSNKRKKDIVELKRLGLESGLFEKISTKNYSKQPTSPFEIWVDLKGKSFRISNVGYGVSQSLPILVECIIRAKGAVFAIQQPEVHLHPKAQAALGSFICFLASREDKKFLIETHSDYLIDRFRYDLSRLKHKHKPSAQVLFFARDKSGNEVFPVSIDYRGRYSESHPKNFKDFFVKEELKLLSL